MKVLHVLHELKYSGAEIMYVDSAHLFQAKGCELTVLATASSVGEYAYNFKKVGYNVLHMPMPLLKKYFSRLKYYSKIYKLLSFHKFDVIHIHSFRAMWGFALCARLCNIKSVYTFHNVFPTSFYSYPYHILLRWTSKKIFGCVFHTISDSVFKHEKNKYYNKTVKIYNWYSDVRYFPGLVEEKNSIREELKISLNALVLISIGGCSVIKQHSEILKALKILLVKIPDIIYLHLGKGESECDEINLSKSLGISQNVIFCNNQQDVRKYLVASDLYLMPSKFEGLAITAIEAMATGIPAIFYDVPGLRDFNINGENCILVPENFQLLAEKILYLIDNPEKAINISNNAFSTVKREFSMKSNVDFIFELYKTNINKLIN
jgi:glycosyltransferase involved in cell wall biosynthesis